MRKTNFIIFFFASVLLILFDLYKASHASFTHDESYTYLHYVSMKVMDIISFCNPTPNNHILNSLSMNLFEKLFGSSELVLRLPNILSHVLYLVFTCKIVNRYSPENFIPFFILLNANPYLIDFFSIARGYGMAIGMMSAGLYFYCRYLENQIQRNQILSLIFICFASLAHFALINVFLILILVHNMLWFYIDRKPFSLKNVWQANKINVIMMALFSIVFYEPIRKLIKYKLLDDFISTPGFWHTTVNSLLNFFAYDAPYKEAIFILLKIFIIAGSLLFVFRCIRYFSLKNSINLAQKLALFFGMIIFFLIAGAIIQHLLFKTPFLKGRFALFIFPLFMFMCGFLLADIASTYRFLVRTVLFLMAAVCFLHTILALNTSWYNEWKYDMNTEKMLQNVYQKSNKDSRISLGITWLFEPTINFYRQTRDLNWLNEVDRNGLKPENDFYYLVPDELRKILRTDVEVLQRYEITGNYLVQHTKKNQDERIMTDVVKSIRWNKKGFHLRAANNKYVCADAARGSLVMANRDKASKWETFSLLSLGNNKWAIFSYYDRFLTSELSNKSEITAISVHVLDWEKFSIVELDSNCVAFRAANGKYLSLDEKSLQLFAIGDSIGKKEKFELIIVKNN